MSKSVNKMCQYNRRYTSMKRQIYKRILCDGVNVCVYVYVCKLYDAHTQLQTHQQPHIHGNITNVLKVHIVATRWNTFQSIEISSFFLHQLSDFELKEGKTCDFFEYSKCCMNLNGYPENQMREYISTAHSENVKNENVFCSTKFYERY